MVLAVISKPVSFVFELLFYFILLCKLCFQFGQREIAVFRVRKLEVFANILLEVILSFVKLLPAVVLYIIAFSFFLLVDFYQYLDYVVDNLLLVYVGLEVCLVFLSDLIFCFICGRFGFLRPLHLNYYLI